MKISIAILSGGKSKRFGRDKAFALINNTPMIRLVYDEIASLSDDVIIVIKNKELQPKYSRLFPEKVKIALDFQVDFNNPIIGVFTCFKSAKYKFCLLLACDLPLIKKEIIEFLIEKLDSYDAIIPRHPNGYIEPMHSIYHAQKSINAIKPLFKGEKDIRMRDFISNLKNVYFISTDLIKRFDQNLDVFLNINTKEDIKKVEEKLRNKL